MNRNKILVFPITVFLLFSSLVIKAQVAGQDAPTVPLSKDILASLDSLMNQFHANSSCNKPQDVEKMNVYGFNSLDIPKYSDSVIYYRLSLLESGIPLDYNRFVKPYIDLYAIRKKDLTSKVLALSQYYFPMFEKVLDQQGLPLEFKYLAVIESALNPRAVSRCGATGLWQFMPATGVQYDLRINPVLDERRDPYLSTMAACAYFKDSYAQYKDWLMVIASYNCGTGNVNKAIRKSGGKRTFWEIQKYLPAETRGYVPAFIAACYVMNYAAEHNIYPDNMCSIQFLLDTVQVDNTLTFDQISYALDIPKSDLMDMNPSYKKCVVPGASKTCTLNLPVDKAIQFEALKKSMASLNPQPLVALKPMLPEGDKTVAINNDETKNGGITQVSLQDQTANKTAPKAYRTTIYTVRSGDGLYTIAAKYKCTMADIKKWNGLKSNFIYAGQKLKVRTAAAAPAMAATTKTVQKPVYHKVKQGESLWSISQKYEGVSVARIKEVNKPSILRSLMPGTLLRIPLGF